MGNMFWRGGQIKNLTLCKGCKLNGDHESHILEKVHYSLKRQELLLFMQLRV
jgi:hypothetical protein